MAIAALVCGILAIVCLGPVAGILAIIFGILAIREAKRTGIGRGMGIAGLVLGIVGSVMAVVLYAIFIGGLFTLGNHLEHIVGPADPSTYELTTGSCTTGVGGTMVYQGTIRNRSSSDKNFNVQVEFDGPSGIELGSGNDVVSGLAPGETRTWSVTAASSSNVSTTPISCHVEEVGNWFN
jgi:hypothetical protein